MLKVLADACSELTAYRDFWLIGALGDWSFEERSTPDFRRYLKSWDDLDLPPQLLSDLNIGINGLLTNRIRQHAGVTKAEHNKEYKKAKNKVRPDIIFWTAEGDFSVEVKYVFDCTYRKQYRFAIPGDREKNPDYQVVFFTSLPNYEYPGGLWYGERQCKRRTETITLVVVAAQYRKLCQFLGPASWPRTNSPHCVDLSQGTETVTQDRIWRRFIRALTKPDEPWAFSTAKHLRGAQVGFAIWDYWLQK